MKGSGKLKGRDVGEVRGPAAGGELKGQVQGQAREVKGPEVPNLSPHPGLTLTRQVNFEAEYRIINCIHCLLQDNPTSTLANVNSQPSPTCS